MLIFQSLDSKNYNRDLMSRVQHYRGTTLDGRVREQEDRDLCVWDAGE